MLSPALRPSGTLDPAGSPPGQRLFRCGCRLQGLLDPCHSPPSLVQGALGVQTAPTDALFLSLPVWAAPVSL